MNHLPHEEAIKNPNMNVQSQLQVLLGNRFYSFI